MCFNVFMTKNPEYGNTKTLINIKNIGICSCDCEGPSYFVQNKKIYLIEAASRMTTKNINNQTKDILWLSI